MTQTKAIDLINPEVLSDSVMAEMEKKVKFAPYAKVDDTLVNQPGDTITRNKYAYIGPAEDLEEGVPVDPAKMSTVESKVTVKEAGKAVEPTQRAVITNVDNTLDIAAEQIGMSIADKIDIDYIQTLSEASLHSNAAPTTVNAIIDAIDLFGDEDEENYILFINPKDYTKLRKELIDGNTFLNMEQAAELLGLQAIVRTKRTPEGTAFIQKQGAVEIVYKKRPEIHFESKAATRSVYILGNVYYATNLYNEAGVVRVGVELPGENGDETPEA